MELIKRRKIHANNTNPNETSSKSRLVDDTSPFDKQQQQQQIIISNISRFVFIDYYYYHSV